MDRMLVILQLCMTYHHRLPRQDDSRGLGHGLTLNQQLNVFHIVPK